MRVLVVRANGIGWLPGTVIVLERLRDEDGGEGESILALGTCLVYH